VRCATLGFEIQHLWCKSKQKKVRYLDIHEDDQFDEAQFASWVKQASQ
jgi:hypothetical protein